MEVEVGVLLIFLVLAAVSSDRTNVAVIPALIRLVNVQNLERLAKGIIAFEKPIIAFIRLLGLIDVCAISTGHTISEVLAAIASIWK